MKARLQEVLELLREQGVDHADIRVSELQEEEIRTDNGQVSNISSTYSKGYGIRVYLDGAMGFAAAQDFDQMPAVALRALEIAKASRLVQEQPMRLAPKPVIVDNYTTPVEIDPFTVSLEEKLALLFAAEKAMREAEPQLFKAVGNLVFQKESKIYADTEGSYITQTLFESGGGIEAVAVNGDIVQTRTYPNSRGNFQTAGYEYVLAMELVENAPRIAHEAVALAKAEPCPAGIYDLLIDSAQLTLQIHESIGHPIELDRVCGHEAAFFGTSFLRPEMIGFVYGSKHVNVVADATAPGGLGTYGYDDEGVPAQCTPIITEGKFMGFLTSRDTASQLGQTSSGASRASKWGRTPIVRMTNINLLPGDKTVDELIGSIDYGFYLQGNKSWSIDDQRLNFQFGCEIAYEIRDGKLTGKIYRDPVYTGVTPQFWRSCDGVASKEFWQMFGTRACGKAEPEQTIHVGHGSAPALFRNVKVGVNHD
ncbi:MAG: TldD/PmbA family protein [Firmicutes bacterium]|nr:TldD/PmbA family protein [Bacillota bacterium]